MCVAGMTRGGGADASSYPHSTSLTLPLPPPLAPVAPVTHTLYCMPLLLLHCQCYYPGMCVDQHNPATHVLRACWLVLDMLLPLPHLPGACSVAGRL